MKKSVKVLYIICIAVILFLIFIGCQNGYVKDQGSIDRSKLNITREDDVTVGDIQWQLTKVEELGKQIPNEFGSLQAIKGKFIFIEFTVENTGQDYLQLLDLKVLDDKGRVYSICNEAYGYFDDPSACTLQDIIPGIKQTFNASFDVPLDSVDLILEVTDLKIPPQEKVYIDMGI